VRASSDAAGYRRQRKAVPPAGLEPAFPGLSGPGLGSSSRGALTLRMESGGYRSLLRPPGSGHHLPQGSTATPPSHTSAMPWQWGSPKVPLPPGGVKCLRGWL
jgi:hypothetical protein